LARHQPLTSVVEDYLEAIFDLAQEKRAVRVKDIAGKLDVTMPSVSSMLRCLGERGLVRYEKREYVELTEEGERIGRFVRERHEALFKFLTTILRIDPSVAEGEACLMEHALSASTLESLTAFMEFVRRCPHAGDDWIRRFGACRQKGCPAERSDDDE